MKYKILAAPFVAALSTIAVAQESQPVTAVPVQAQAPVTQAEHFIPANTEIVLRMNEEITTRRNEEGDTFNLSLVHDVRLSDYVVIPAGTRAVGEITWMTGRGMFGKSGKMDIELRYIDLNGRRIPIEGQYRQEGEGNTVATVAGVLLVPVAGLFITGRSGVIPQGRELSARMTERLPVALPAGAVVNEGVSVAAVPAQTNTVTATPVAVSATPAAVPVAASGPVEPDAQSNITAESVVETDTNSCVGLTLAECSARSE
jgi:hypothetical protein